MYNRIRYYSMSGVVLLLTTGLLIGGCAGSHIGKFRKLSDPQEMHLMQNLEAAWEVYHIRYIPDHTLLFDPKRDQLVVLTDKQWIEVKTQPQWVSIVQKELRQNETSFGWLSMTGFE